MLKNGKPGNRSGQQNRKTEVDVKKCQKPKNQKSQRPPPICMYKVPDDENCERFSEVIMLLPQTMKCYHKTYEVIIFLQKEFSQKICFLSQLG